VIQVVVARPGERAERTTIDERRLEEWQQLVGGHLEVFRLPPLVAGVCAYINEDGQALGLTENLRILWSAVAPRPGRQEGVTAHVEQIRGPMVFFLMDGDAEAGLTDELAYEVSEWIDKARGIA
jgi:hypothetical protein